MEITHKNFQETSPTHLEQIQKPNTHSNNRFKQKHLKVMEGPEVSRKQ